MARAVAAGRLLSVDAAVAEGLRVTVPAGDSPHRATHGQPLSPRERQVAAQLARGLSNAQIGQELVISRGTVERHVANILTKLDYRSRSQVAVWAAAHNLLIQPGTPAQGSDV
jgi:DNA-binding NarL/FixJ family response regulator